MKREIGTRIGAMLGSDAEIKTIDFLGYGVYEGEHVPPEDIGGLNVGLPNPKLKLDSGKVVWGCECWWGGEAAVKSRIEKWCADGYSVIDVDIDEARAKANAKETANEPAA